MTEKLRPLGFVECTDANVRWFLTLREMLEDMHGQWGMSVYADGSTKDIELVVDEALDKWVIAEGMSDADVDAWAEANL